MKPHPEYVIPQIADRSIATGKDRNMLWSEYIRFHYKMTGKLAPGCDAKDFYAYIDKLGFVDKKILDS